MSEDYDPTVTILIHRGMFVRVRTFLNTFKYKGTGTMPQQ